MRNLAKRNWSHCCPSGAWFSLSLHESARQETTHYTRGRRKHHLYRHVTVHASPSQRALHQTKACLVYPWKFANRPINPELKGTLLTEIPQTQLIPLLSLVFYRMITPPTDESHCFLVYSPGAVTKNNEFIRMYALLMGELIRYRLFGTGLIDFRR